MNTKSSGLDLDALKDLLSPMRDSLGSIFVRQGQRFLVRANGNMIPVIMGSAEDDDDASEDDDGGDDDGDDDDDDDADGDDDVADKDKKRLSDEAKRHRLAKKEAIARARKAEQEVVDLKARIDALEKGKDDPKSEEKIASLEKERDAAVSERDKYKSEALRFRAMSDIEKVAKRLNVDAGPKVVHALLRDEGLLEFGDDDRLDSDDLEDNIKQLIEDGELRVIKSTRGGDTDGDDDDDDDGDTRGDRKSQRRFKGKRDKGAADQAALRNKYPALNR